MRDADEARTVRRLVADLEVVERQQELERLSDMAIELLATACVLARTQQLLQQRGESECAPELHLVANEVRAAGGYGVEDAILPARPAPSDDGATPGRLDGEAPSRDAVPPTPAATPSRRPSARPTQ